MLKKSIFINLAPTCFMYQNHSCQVAFCTLSEKTKFVVFWDQPFQLMNGTPKGLQVTEKRAFFHRQSTVMPFVTIANYYTKTVDSVEGVL